MLTKESIATLPIDDYLKSQIGSLIDTVENQKTSFAELVEINKSCSKDNDRLREELETTRKTLAEINECNKTTLKEVERLQLKAQAYSRRFGVNL